MTNQIEVTREGEYTNSVVMVDGLWGCGKTMLSPIIASFPRVELLSYLYEMEYTCSLYHLEKISKDAACAMVRILTDLKLYNIMMGRDVNFRPSDLSSAIRDIDPSRYFSRLFEKGDEAIPEKIKIENPILHLATHNILPFSEPIFEGLGNKAKLIEVVRHPLYMFKQILLNMEALIGDTRDFTIYFKKGNDSYPYYVKGWHDEYGRASVEERAILYIHHLMKLSSKYRKKYPQNILTIPFEKFVLDPDPHIKSIGSLLGVEANEDTQKMLTVQKVPREKTVQGLDLDIYRRCGWTPGDRNLTEKEELELRYEFAKKNLNKNYIKILDALIKNYESHIWSP